VRVENINGVISGSNFTGNLAGSGGGALACTTFSSVTLSSCRFSGNRAGTAAGAVLVYPASPTVADLARLFVDQVRLCFVFEC
jgi:predicted outer membrane repeat protein